MYIFVCIYIYRHTIYIYIYIYIYICRGQDRGANGGDRDAAAGGEDVAGRVREGHLCGAVQDAAAAAARRLGGAGAYMHIYVWSPWRSRCVYDYLCMVALAEKVRVYIDSIYPSIYPIYLSI